MARLLGAPRANVGYEEAASLTEAIRRRPYAVLLLDEVEKATRGVSTLLLQVLDDGRLTDSQGRNRGLPQHGGWCHDPHLASRAMLERARQDSRQRSKPGCRLDEAVEAGTLRPFGPDSLIASMS